MFSIKAVLSILFFVTVLNILRQNNLYALQLKSAMNLLGEIYRRDPPDYFYDLIPGFLAHYDRVMLEIQGPGFERPIFPRRVHEEVVEPTLRDVTTENPSIPVDINNAASTAGAPVDSNIAGLSSTSARMDSKTAGPCTPSAPMDSKIVGPSTISASVDSNIIGPSTASPSSSSPFLKFPIILIFLRYETF